MVEPVILLTLEHVLQYLGIRATLIRLRHSAGEHSDLSWSASAQSFRGLCLEVLLSSLTATYRRRAAGQSPTRPKHCTTATDNHVAAVQLADEPVNS